MRGQKIRRPLQLLAVGSLAVHPALFVGLAGLSVLLSGPFRLLAYRPRRREWLLVLALVITPVLISQSLHVITPWEPQEMVPEWIASSAGGSGDAFQTDNIFRLNSLSYLESWNQHDETASYAVPTEDGFWRLQRENGETGHRNTEFLTRVRQPVEPSATYTLSVYYRHDGTDGDFDLIVRLPDGRHVRPGTEHSAPVDGRGRATTTFTVPDGVQDIRALHLAGFEGDWTSLDLGYAQLELGAVATDFVPPLQPEAPLPGVLWWFLIGAQAALAVLFGFSLCSTSAGRGAFYALLTGLCLQLLIVAGQALGGVRSSALLGDPNLLGHSTVAVLGLGWILSGPVLSRRFALLMAVGTILVLASGSRLATAALILLFLLQLAGNLRRSGRLAFTLAVLLTVAILAIWSGGTRFDSAIPAAAAGLGERQAAWDAAIAAFQDRPLAGIGLQNFAAFYQLHAPTESGVRPFTEHAHNLALSLAAEGGVLGLLSLSGFLIVVLAFLIGNRALRALQVLILVLLLNLFDYTFFFGGVFLPLLVVLSLGAAGESKSTVAAPDSSGLTANV